MMEVIAIGGVAGVALTLFAGVLTAQKRRSNDKENLPRLLKKRAAQREVFVTFRHPDIA